MLEETKKSSSSYTHQSQALFDRFAADQRLTTVQPRDASVDIMTVPARDEERDRLDARHKDLEVERRKFTEAAVQLGKEKAALEVKISSSSFS